MWGLVPHGLAKGKGFPLPPIKGGAPLPFFPSNFLPLFSSLNVVPVGGAHGVENSLLKHTAMLLVFGPSLYFRNLRTSPETGSHRLYRTCVIPRGAPLAALVA